VPRLNTANGFYVGSDEVGAVYRGAAPIWQRGSASSPPDFVASFYGTAADGQTTVTVALSGVEAGDLLLAYLVCAAGTGSLGPPTPAGWVLLDSYSVGSSLFKAGVFYRVAEAAETSAALAFAYGATAARAHVRQYRAQAGKPFSSGPLAEVATVRVTTTGSSLQAPAVTTLVPEALVAYSWMWTSNTLINPLQLPELDNLVATITANSDIINGDLLVPVAGEAPLPTVIGSANLGVKHGTTVAIKPTSAIAEARYTGFGEYEAGALPADWRLGTTLAAGAAVTLENVGGANELRYHYGTSPGTNGQNAYLPILWRYPGPYLADCEVLAECRVESAAINVQLGIYLRCTYTSAGWPMGYILGLRSSGAAMHQITPGLNGFDVGSTQAFTVTQGEVYTLRFRAQGSTLLGKAWLSSEAEPAEWGMTAVHSLFGAGGLGLVARQSPVTGATGDSVFRRFAYVVGSGSAVFV
jgi:hypothetical protein